MKLMIDFILLIFGILQIALFFKIWAMTNNVKEMLLILKKRSISDETSKESISSDKNKYLFSVGDLVIRKLDKKQMRVKSITPEGKFSCYSNGGVIHEGDFESSEITLFQ